ncbi:MAG: DUF3794 domain-containing protein [Clostridia bacterium]|nr:DUF3794 domain-containing protein [Clostridia bacterium]
MELIKESIGINETVHKGSTQTMIEGDIIVPDTKPDILKVLQVDGIACITKKTAENGRATVYGRIDLKILYIPDKEGEKIKSILTSFDFSQPLENQGITSDSLIAAIASAERVEFSLINSRKLRIKAIVAVGYEIFNPKILEVAVDSADEEDVELKRENIKIQNSVDFCEHEINVHESLEVPGGQTSIGELLKVDAKIADTEYKVVTGKIVIKGVICVCMLYSDESGDIEFTEEEIPFTEVIDSENAGDETICDIDYTIKDMNCRVTEDSDGDNRIVDAEFFVGVQIRASESMELEMIDDCYAPYRKTELMRENVVIEEIAAKLSSQNTIREVIDAGVNAPAVSGVYNAITRPCITKAELQRNKLLCEGKIEAYILYLSQSAENPIYSIKKEIPFSYMLDCEAEDDNLIPEIKAEIKHTSYNLNAAGEIELRCILSLNANVIRRRNMNIISEALTEEIDNNEKRGIVIYFVQKGDSLWSVAKNYSVPIGSIVDFNNLKENEKLRQGERLFIPN